MGATLLLYYDEYHTPLDFLSYKLSQGHPVTVLIISLDHSAEAPGLSLNTSWPVVQVDGRRRFCEEYITRAIKANARYQNGYFLSAALSRPLMASICSEQLQKLGADTLIHGLAGNDQLRFEMGLGTLSPQTRIVSVASIVGSRSRSNDNSFTESSNLWGSSLEAGQLTDPWRQPEPEVFRRLSVETDSSAKPETHTIRFDTGHAVALDGTEMPLEMIIKALRDLGRKFGVGSSDIVEDGYVGLKTRAIYESAAALALIIAHQDLERLVSTRAQNMFKPLVDQAWAELVYNGFWFDPQRSALEAYIEEVNQWVAGEVRLLFKPDSLTVAGRSSPFALYDENRAVYRVGQDFAVTGIRDMAMLISEQMKAARSRELGESIAAGLS